MVPCPPTQPRHPHRTLHRLPRPLINWSVMIALIPRVVHRSELLPNARCVVGRWRQNMPTSAVRDAAGVILVVIERSPSTLDIFSQVVVAIAANQPRIR